MTHKTDTAFQVSASLIASFAGSPGYTFLQRAGCLLRPSCIWGSPGSPWYKNIPRAGSPWSKNVPRTLGTKMYPGLAALGPKMYPGLATFGPKMYLGLPTLGTKIYLRLVALGTFLYFSTKGWMSPQTFLYLG